MISNSLDRNAWLTRNLRGTKCFHFETCLSLSAILSAPPPNSITQLGCVVTNVDIVHRHRLVETRVNAEHSLGRNRFSREFLHKTASHFRRIFSTNGEKSDGGYTFFLRKLANFSSVMCFCPINLVSFSKLHPRLSFEKTASKIILAMSSRSQSNPWSDFLNTQYNTC